MYESHYPQSPSPIPIPFSVPVRRFQDGRGQDFSDSYGAGDTVGCGLDWREGRVFFTKNGEFSGVAFQGVDVGDDAGWYPTVSLKHVLSRRSHLLPNATNNDHEPELGDDEPELDANEETPEGEQEDEPNVLAPGFGLDTEPGTNFPGNNNHNTMSPDHHHGHMASNVNVGHIGHLGGAAAARIRRRRRRQVVENHDEFTDAAVVNLGTSGVPFRFDLDSLQIHLDLL